VFSKHLSVQDDVLRALAATGAFCAVSGAVYAFNDVHDAKADRAHPIKCKRPIAAGELSERSGLIVAAILATAAIAGSALLAPWLAAIVAAYMVNNIAYSLGLKRVPFIDVLSISAGFIMRVMAGGIAIDVPVSVWLLACTALLSALLGFGKRAHELSAAGDSGDTRRSLRYYRISHLRIAMVVLSISTCAAYALYTQDPHTVSAFDTRHLIWTLPFCVLGIFRFAQLAVFRPTPLSPTDAMLRDIPFIVNLVAWAAVTVTLIYR